jgi:hypothetical protein
VAAPIHGFATPNDAMDFYNNVEETLKQKEWPDSEESEIETKVHSLMYMRPQFSLDCNRTVKLERIAKIKNVTTREVMAMMIENKLNECRNNPD